MAEVYFIAKEYFYLLSYIQNCKRNNGTIRGSWNIAYFTNVISVLTWILEWFI